MLNSRCSVKEYATQQHDCTKAELTLDCGLATVAESAERYKAETYTDEQWS